MIWLVQKALFGDEFGYDNFLAAIDHAGERRIPLDYVFWESTIDLKLTGVDNLHEVIPFGTREFTAYGIKNRWRIYWDKGYSYPALRCLGKEFINWDLTVAPLDNLKLPDSEKVYIREAAGFNIIKGKVISSYAWPEWIAGFKRDETESCRGHHDWHPINGDTLFVAAPVKTILDEYRCWVIDGKVISSSCYVHNGVIEYSNTDDDFEVNHYAQQMVDRLPFSMRNFVLDVFRTTDGLRVGELNCIHCSGWYAINSGKVVRALVEQSKFPFKRC